MARRIRRVGLDTGANYTLQQTSAYDENNPPSTVSSWGSAAEVAAMDQSLSSTTGELTRQGALISFIRIPDFFSGLIVRLRPSYDPVDTPFLELWTHAGSTWTRRRRFALNNLLTGVRSGERKVFVLLLTTDLVGVDMVWVTMTPSGAAVNRFIAIHVYGECTPDVDPMDPCEVDPETCIEPDPCLVDPEPCLDDPIVPDPEEDPPVPLPPPFPPIDLCDEEAVAAFEATLTPEQLEYWNELVGTIELNCDDETDHPPENNPGGDINPEGLDEPPFLPAQPTETYTDPVDVEPACDPDLEDVDCTPGDAFEPDNPNDPVTNTNTYIGFYFYDNGVANAKTFFLANYLASGSVEVINGYANKTEELTGLSILALQDGERFDFTNMIDGAVIGVRVREITCQTTYSEYTHFDGSGFHGPGARSIDITAGVFATQNPNPLAPSFRFDREAGPTVDFLRLKYNAGFPTAGGGVAYALMFTITTTRDGLTTIEPTGTTY